MFLKKKSHKKDMDLEGPYIEEDPYKRKITPNIIQQNASSFPSNAIRTTKYNM